MSGRARAAGCRNWLMLAAVVVLSAGCGGSPSEPSSPDAVLISGSYRLVMYLPVPSCEGQACVAILLCGGGLGPGSSAVVPVFLSRNGDEATVQQNDRRSTLTMTLRISATVSGTISGRAFDATGTAVDIRGTGDQPASVTGRPAHRGTVMGVLNGRVSFGGSTCSGDQSAWRLEPGG